MDFERIRKTILKATGIYERALNVGEIPFYEECFNLIKREDGKWEVFYGEHGYKSNLKEYDTEEEASRALMQRIKGKRLPRQKGSLHFFDRWKRRRQDTKNKGTE